MDLYDLSDGFPSMKESLARIKSPTMVIGIQTDVLIPVQQQRMLAKMLTEAGNHAVTYYELNSIYGHDTFLLDLSSVGTAIKVGGDFLCLLIGRIIDFVHWHEVFTFHFLCPCARHFPFLLMSAQELGT